MGNDVSLPGFTTFVSCRVIVFYSNLLNISIVRFNLDIRILNSYEGRYC